MNIITINESIIRLNYRNIITINESIISLNYKCYVRKRICTVLYGYNAMVIYIYMYHYRWETDWNKTENILSLFDMKNIFRNKFTYISLIIDFFF